MINISIYDGQAQQVQPKQTKVANRQRVVKNKPVKQSKAVAAKPVNTGVQSKAVPVVSAQPQTRVQEASKASKSSKAVSFLKKAGSYYPGAIAFRGFKSFKKRFRW